MARFLVAYLVIRHPVAAAMTLGWIAALSVLGAAQGWITWSPVVVMVLLSISVPHWLRQAGAAREQEQAAAELAWMRTQAELNAQAIFAEWDRLTS